MKLNLLAKTELWVRGIVLSSANLGDIAKVTAELLGLPPDRVIVVDVGDDHVTLDLLTEDIDAEHILGKESELLERLSLLDGVSLTKNASVHSEGILGLISVDPEAGSRAMKRASEMSVEIRSRLEKRVVVFATGFEVQRGMIEDTNTPWIAQRFSEKGYCVTVGGILPDDVESIAGALRRAAHEGYGLAITTGGVGAEEKDCTIEAVLKLDPSAETRYTVKFTKGTGRHAKSGVRIAVGAAGGMMIVALPGPHDEVVAATGVLLECLDEHATRAETASRIASVLKARLTGSCHGHRASGTHC